jgi:GTP-binding protein
MEIRQAEFISSLTQVAKSRGKKMSEFAFIGRSNVGKSSLVNMLMARKGLAKVSNTPGKTQTINHYLINQAWYLVDLPGYGFAKTNKTIRQGFGKIIDNYVLKSENLFFLFVLVDIRLEPQKIDLSFLEWAGSHEVPLGIIFTKADKLSAKGIVTNTKKYELELNKRWEELPPIFITSSTNKKGRKEVLDFIDDCLKTQSKK